MTLYVALDRVRDNPWQPRTVRDEERIAALAADILSYLPARRETLGLLQLPAGRLVDDAGQAVQLTAPAELITAGDITDWLTQAGAYVQLAYGHTRAAAFQYLVAEHPEYAVLPVAIVEFDDQSMATAAWSENERRKDLTPLEQARAVERYMRDFGWTQQQAADKLHLDRSTVANKLRLLKLPQAQQELMQRGELSERQALALVPLTELPKSLVKEVESSYAWNKPSKIFKDAPNTSSDEIRRSVESLIEQTSKPLANVPFVDHPFEVVKGIVAATCGDCPARLKRANGQHRCVDLGCYAKKTDGWGDHRLAAAVAATGIQGATREPPYQEREGFYGDLDHGTAIVKAGCARLRLLVGGGGSLRPKNFPDVSIICHHPGEKQCACLRRLKAEATRNDPAHIEERERKKATQRDYIAPAETAVLAAIQVNNLGAWRKLLRGVDYQIGNKAADMTLEQIQAAVAHALVKNALGYQSNEYPDRAKRDLEALFKDFGIAAPWCDPLADVRAKFERIQKWMAEITKECPTLEALRGNITNLERLADELNTLPTQEEPWALLGTQIGDAINELNDLLPIVEQHGQLTLIAMHMVHILVTSPDEDQVESVIDELEFVPAYHYALALLPDTPAMHGRIARLLDRLAELANASVCAQTQAVEAG